jgi:hypothetical protein
MSLQDVELFFCPLTVSQQTPPVCESSVKVVKQTVALNGRIWFNHCSLNPFFLTPFFASLKTEVYIHLLLLEYIPEYIH